MVDWLVDFLCGELSIGVHLPAVLHRGSACFWNNGVVAMGISFDALCYVVSMQKNVEKGSEVHRGSRRGVRRSNCERLVDVADANHGTRLRSAFVNVPCINILGGLLITTAP